MTFRPSLAILLALALAGCGNEREAAAAADWGALLARGDGVGEEVLLRRTIEEGAPRTALAPFLGQAEMLQGDLEEAHEWLDRAEFAPQVAAHGFRMLGKFWMREGNLPAAGRAFDRALAIAPDDPDLWVDIGRLRWRGGEQAQAVEASRRALALGPDNPAALLFRAQVVRDAEGNLAALPFFERGLAKTPEDVELLGEYAATLGELGRARDMLAAVRRMPRNPRAYYLQAVLAARAGQNDLARSLLLRSGDLGRETPGAMLLLGLVDLDEGNFESAAQGFDRLLRLQPDNRRVRLLLARALFLSGNYRELIARFGLDAETPYLAALVGRAYEALGERLKAARYLDGADALYAPRLTTLAAGKGAGGDAANAVAIVRAAIAAGRTADGQVAARDFLAKYPGSADAMALAGDAALATGDARRALGHYRAAASIRRLWPLTKRMVLAHDSLGEGAAASSLIEWHLVNEPFNAEARLWLTRRSTS